MRLCWTAKNEEPGLATNVGYSVRYIQHDGDIKGSKAIERVIV